jgi:hypothetical protein
VITDGAGIVGDNPLEDFEQREDFDFKTGFLADFAAQRSLEQFARFHHAARQRPPALERLMAALYKQDAFSIAGAIDN